MGQTVDDAAGEAFDKVGKMLGFCYPAGKSIEKEASLYTGTNNSINFPIARIWANPLDFSFSGLKTAVKYFLSSKDSDFIKNNRPAICESFQNTVIQSLRSRLVAASQKSGIRRIALVGGVACNSRLREELKKCFCNEIYFPSTLLCTDNAAMIALAAQKRAEKGITRFPQMNPSASL
jgi:N6-L-threonylcarbamoyladenine synthase